MTVCVRRALGTAVLLGTASVTALAVGPGPAGAATPASTVYVGAHAGTGGSCSRPDYASVQDAIEAVATGGTVVVCPGTYPGGITVDRRVTLSGRGRPTIDATGLPYGVGVTASGTTVRGLRVIGASDTTDGPADGIITAGFGPAGPVAADDVRIIGNELSGNLGAGIDLNSTSHSAALGNVSNDNGIGVNVSDDLGAPAVGNQIIGNVTDENFGGCGIALADHSGLGVIGTFVAGNVADDNGLSTPTAPDASAGSGVILASPIPGGVVRDNTVTGNRFDGNGHGGVVVHAHAPGTDFSGNSITGNRIRTNNLRTDVSDPETTGIYLGSASPLTIRVAGNVIGPDHYGIFTAGDVTLTGGANVFTGVAVRYGHVAAY